MNRTRVREAGIVALSSRDTARYYKENPKGVDIMCRAFEDTRKEKALRIAKNLIVQGQLTLEIIADVTELPLEEIQKLAAEVANQK